MSRQASWGSSPPLPQLFALGLEHSVWRTDFYLTRGDRDYTLANPQNLRPIFTQEQFATSLRATQLRNVAMGVAALVDCSVPILTISAE